MMKECPALRARWKNALFCLVVAAGCVSLFLTVRACLPADLPQPPSLPALPAAPDDSFYDRLLQATVCLAPEGEPFRGCGVLVDPKDNLVVTDAAVMGDRDRARACFATDTSGNVMPTDGPFFGFEIGGRVVHREILRGLILLRLDRLPSGAAPLPLGEWSASPSRVLHSVRWQAFDHAAGVESFWSHSQGRIGMVYMPPHY